MIFLSRWFFLSIKRTRRQLREDFDLWATRSGGKMAHKNKVLVPFFNSDAEREKGAAASVERENTKQPPSLLPKNGLQIFLMNSFRFPCLNVRMARARAQHVRQSRKMFVILLFFFPPAVHCYYTHRYKTHVVYAYYKYTRLTNSFSSGDSFQRVDQVFGCFSLQFGGPSRLYLSIFPSPLF